MSVSNIPEKIKYALWGKSAGRCEYDGCNKQLWLDHTTKRRGNISYIAHIIADEPKGPRGHNKLSKELGTNITNLMLLCDEHHRLIDKIDVEAHTVERLIEMKRKHEERITIQTSIGQFKSSHILLYGANIGSQASSITWDNAAYAMVPDWYPAEESAIELSLIQCAYQDHEPNYWAIQRENLQRLFNSRLKPRLERGEIRHLSIFALAPQPLLVELGRLLTDIYPAEVYQLHREPQNWKWQNKEKAHEYRIVKPTKIKAVVALNVSLSASIDNSRILNVLGDNVSIWTLTIDNPNNDFLKSTEQLRLFRECLRGLFIDIKNTHGEDAVLNIFPAAPVAAAVEIGRVWMPKADLSLKIYDQSKKLGHFIPTFEITGD